MARQGKAKQGKAKQSKANRIELNVNEQICFATYKCQPIIMEKWYFVRSYNKKLSDTFLMLVTNMKENTHYLIQ